MLEPTKGLENRTHVLQIDRATGESLAAPAGPIRGIDGLLFIRADAGTIQQPFTALQGGAPFTHFYQSPAKGNRRCQREDRDRQPEPGRRDEENASRVRARGPPDDEDRRHLEGKQNPKKDPPRRVVVFPGWRRRFLIRRPARNNWRSRRRGRNHGPVLAHDPVNGSNGNPWRSVYGSER